MVPTVAQRNCSYWGCVIADRYRDVVHGSSASPPELLPSHTPTCMGCGPDNPNGLHLMVYRSGDTVYADATFDERHIGAPGLGARRRGRRRMR